jgi:hypothetical protein
MAADSEGRGGEDVNRERRYSIRSDRECRAEGCQHRSPAGAEEDDKRKLYALHAPEVECIGKGKGLWCNLPAVLSSRVSGDLRAV